MTALHFGDSSSALLGVWSQPVDGVERDHGVLLCPPIAQEHVRSHWALRQVAAALGRVGFHCFRFDWFGVGDSAGELRDATITRWKEDLTNAAQELRDMTGVSRLSLVGLRVGATVAALAAEAVRPSAIVLWDPVIDGRGYIAVLRNLTRQALSDPRRYWERNLVRRTRPCELVGFDFGPHLLAELEQINLRVGAMLPEVPVCLLRSCDDADLVTLGKELSSSHREVEVHDTELRARWTSAREIEQLLLPGDALRTLTTFLEARAA